MISLEPGKYIVAVSGGVDSIVLLDLLSKQPGLELVVAHFDHGIRKDSAKDRKLVKKTAVHLGLVFEYAEGKLGHDTSEERARKVRYEFLNSVKEKYGAKAIVTAHHQDDLLETALINLLRGTGRKGLTSLSSNVRLVRPLLNFQKTELIKYAESHELAWREDSTNKETDYLRNYLRLNIILKLSKTERGKLLSTVSNLKNTNLKIDKEIANYLQITDKTKDVLDKKLVNDLSHSLACEVMAEWLRVNNIRQFDRKTIERLVVSAKTFKSGQRADINNKNYLEIHKTNLKISKSPHCSIRLIQSV